MRHLMRKSRSLTRRDVTSLAATKNKAVKICKDALTAVCVPLSRIPPVSAYFALHAAIRIDSEEEPKCTLPEISRNIHNANNNLKGDRIYFAKCFLTLSKYDYPDSGSNYFNGVFF